MKKLLFAVLTAAAAVLPAFSAEDTRVIRLVQDDAQVRTTTKIYNLKNVRATDIVSFVNVATRRYYMNSQVRALNFSANKQQSLIVTTANEFIPYVDQIVSVLDRESAKKDPYGSSLRSTGYRWKVYQPNYRLVNDLMMPANVMLSNTGNVFAYNGKLWIKDDLDDVDYALDWVKYFDRPLPQASLTFRYYFVRESTLRDIGIDYLAWKNGPGMNLLDVAYNSGRVAWDRILNTAVNVAGNSAFSWTYGGVFTAPAFDMSFIRMLQQSGEAKIMAEASLNVINHQKVARISLIPSYNGIVKNPENHTNAVKEVPTGMVDMMVNVYDPGICFFTEKSEVNDMGWIPTTKEFYAKNKGSIMFAYDITSTDPTEANNYGTQIDSTTYTESTYKLMEFGREQLLAHAVRDFDVEQTTGVPFLCQLPILKYIFGTTTTIKEKNYVFVTVEPKLVHPESNSADAAVKALTEAKK